MHFPLCVTQELSYQYNTKPPAQIFHLKTLQQKKRYIIENIHNSGILRENISKKVLLKAVVKRKAL